MYLGSSNKLTRVHHSLLKKCVGLKEATRVMHVELNYVCIDIGKKKRLAKFGSQAGSGQKKHAKFNR